jgi:putative ABC transport system permease protein
MSVFLALISEAFAAIWANRLRSFLTVLGIVVGVTSVIAIVSTVEGLQDDMEQSFATMGQNTFMVTRFGFGMSWSEYLERRKRKKLHRDLIPIIEQGCPDCAEVGAESYDYSHLKYGPQRMTYVEIRGETPNILEMRDFDVLMGRYLTWEDERRRRQVGFIGHRVYEKFFAGQDPTGEVIKIGQREFTVIGVAEKNDGAMVSGLDNFVVIPLATHHKIYPDPGDPVNLVISAKSFDRREAAMDQVRVVLRSARHIPYEENDDFTMVTPDAILSFINDLTRAYRVLMISLPLLSIVVGGIVIMNIMMISVTERTREIGIRKSIGAKANHIMMQFLYESIILSLIGGALGIVCGIWLGDLILRSLLEIEVTPTTMAIILGFGISTAVGVFFGIYPAMKAARLDPIEALGYE